MSLFLTAEELAQLTGRTRSDCQRQWLQKNAWKFAENLNRQPVVSRAYAEYRLGGSPAAANAPVLPNFDALRRAG